jgi:hypothetical protein
MLAKFAEGNILRQLFTHHLRGRFRKQHLPAMPNRHDARGPVNRRAEVVAVAFLRDAGVQPAAHPEREAAVGGNRAHPPLQFERRGDRLGGIVERGVQPVAGHLHEVAAVRGDDRVTELVVARQRVGHPRGLGLPQSRAAFDVREEEGHGAP